MNRRDILLFGASTGTLALSSCTRMINQTQDGLDSALWSVVRDPGIPLASLSVATVRGGALHIVRGFDNRPTSAANLPPISGDTLYRIASISKLICTIGAMRLVERGTLALDADVSDVLGWRLRNPAFANAPITVRQLLSHTSSLRDDGGYNFPATQTLRSVLETEPKCWGKQGAPGAYFRYANLPWGVLATVMEIATRERFDHLIHRLVFQPLSLDGGFHPHEFSKTSLARVTPLYRKRDEKEVWQPNAEWRVQVDDAATQPAPRAPSDYVIGSNGTLMSPQGGARLSVRGLATIARLLLNGGEVDGVRLLKTETVAAMLTRVWDVNRDQGDSDFDEGVGSIAGWGLGVQHFVDKPGAKGDRLVESGGFSGVGHFGFAYGLTSALVIDPRTRNAMTYCQGGTGNDPEQHKGTYSSNYRFEERIFSALYTSLMAT